MQAEQNIRWFIYMFAPRKFHLFVLVVKDLF